MDGTREDRLARRLELAAKTLGLVYGLASLAWLVWIMIPEHQRKLMAMRGTEAIRRGAERTACRTGHQAMGQELASGIENYALPYACSLVREKAAEVYERIRYS